CHEDDAQGDCRGSGRSPAPSAEVDGGRSDPDDPAGTGAGGRHEDLRGAARPPRTRGLLDRPRTTPPGPFVIAVDSSSWIAYLSGSGGPGVSAVEEARAQRQACLPPVMLLELLAAPIQPARVPS